MGAAKPACLMPSGLFGGRVADERPQGCADLPAAGRVRPALQVTRTAYATAPFLTHRQVPMRNTGSE